MIHAGHSSTAGHSWMESPLPPYTVYLGGEGRSTTCCRHTRGRETGGRGDQQQQHCQYRSWSHGCHIPRLHSYTPLTSETTPVVFDHPPVLHLQVCRPRRQVLELWAPVPVVRPFACLRLSVGDLQKRIFLLRLPGPRLAVGEDAARNPLHQALHIVLEFLEYLLLRRGRDEDLAVEQTAIRAAVRWVA